VAVYAARSAAAKTSCRSTIMAAGEAREAPPEALTYVCPENSGF
jgi:hypothetical protein